MASPSKRQSRTRRPSFNRCNSPCPRQHQTNRSHSVVTPYLVLLALFSLPSPPLHQTIAEPYSARTPVLVRSYLNLTNCSVRGGASISSGKEEISAVDENDASTSDTRISKKTRPWYLLFDLHDDVKAAASDTLVAKRNEPGRGGALVKQKPVSSSSPWLESAMRFFQNEKEDTEAEYNSRTQQQSSTAMREATKSARGISKLWWIHSWSDQLPDIHDEVLMEEELQAREKVDKVFTSGATTKPQRASLVDVNDRKNIIEKQSESASEVTVTNTKKSASSNVDNLSGEVTVAALNAAIENEEDTHQNSVVESSAEPPLRQANAIFPNAMEQANASATEEMSLESPYVSSGYWNTIDKVLTMGLAAHYPGFRLSSRLRPVRKVAAKVTGMHGVLSGKPHRTYNNFEDEHVGLVRRRLAAIERARKNLENATDRAVNISTATGKSFWTWWREEPADRRENDFAFIVHTSESQRLEELRRTERVREIDRLMQKSQEQLMQLACEKDVLQRRLNPLWNYTTMESMSKADLKAPKRATAGGVAEPSREFNFPPEDLVDEYLNMLFASGRLVRLNHTELWRNANADDVDDEDELASPLVQSDADRKKRSNPTDGAGSWFLRNGLGEKIGQTAETAAYKGICAAVMGVLARSLSSLHGVNVMTYSDIRLYTEQAPELPPISAGMIPGSRHDRNYAHDAVRDAMRRGSRKKRSKKRSNSFIQREAVVETLLSQCQLAAPLLKVFPIAWQRAILANIITMAAAIITDFCEGIEFQILGHKLSISFTPITEEDLIQGITSGSFSNHRSTSSQRFEDAVRATAEEVGENLKFLDRWHERALGGGVLRTQIATLIARLVLTLVDDILTCSRMDLWTAHAGGPRLVAGLEYRLLNSANIAATQNL